MTLDGRAALEEYLRLVVPGRMLLKAVFASRLYQFFVQAAPGLRELMMLGKVYYEAGQIDAKLPARRHHNRRCARQRPGDEPAQDADGGALDLRRQRGRQGSAATFRG